MQLKQFLHDNGLKINYIASKADVSRGTIYRVLIGKPISFEYANRIRGITDKEVEIEIAQGKKSHVRYRGKKVSTESNLSS